MKKLLLLIPFLALSLASCDFFKPKDNGGENTSTSQKTVDSTVYGTGEVEGEVLSVGYDIPAGEYWVRASGVDNHSGFAIYDKGGYNPDSEYENLLWSTALFEGEYYLTKVKSGQFLVLRYTTLQNSKVKQDYTSVKNGMFKVGEQIVPVDGNVRVRLCDKGEMRQMYKHYFEVFTYNEKLGKFERNSLDSKTFGVFEEGDGEYHTIENPPIDSYIELVGLEVC